MTTFLSETQKPTGRITQKMITRCNNIKNAVIFMFLKPKLKPNVSSYFVHTFWQRFEIFLHQDLNTLQVEQGQDVVKLRLLLVPHIDYVLQIWNGQLFEAVLQEVQHLVPRQSLHFRQVFSENLDRRDFIDQISQTFQFKIDNKKHRSDSTCVLIPSVHPQDSSSAPRVKTQRSFPCSPLLCVGGLEQSSEI